VVVVVVAHQAPMVVVVAAVQVATDHLYLSQYLPQEHIQL
jgi:hypothetical protein